jgi:flagellar basal body-associated protein FliL
VAFAGMPGKNSNSSRTIIIVVAAIVFVVLVIMCRYLFKSEKAKEES